MDIYIGTIEDPRSDFEKSKDYKHEDLARGADVALIWKEKTEEEWNKYVIRNQDGSSACVAFATAKLLGMHEVMEGRPFANLSPKFIYTRRANYPDGGMWLPNALDIACHNGDCEESLLPCDNKGESFMNDKNQETVGCVVNAEQFKGKFYFEIKTRNIDEIAKIIQQGYGVLLGIRFDYNEYTDVPFIDPNSKLSCGHGVPALDSLLYKGEKALLIEDSWGPHYGKGGHRIITETFLNTRCFYAGYVTSLPNYVFTKTLRMNATGIDVKMLQQKLKISVDGKFGPKTLKTVIIFQEQHGLHTDGVVGPKTNVELNKI